MLIESHEEWAVEEILCARPKKRGRGREALVQWAGYHEPTWEPLENLADTAALDDFEEKYGDARTNDGPRKKYVKKKKGRGGTTQKGAES